MWGSFWPKKHKILLCEESEEESPGTCRYKCTFSSGKAKYVIRYQKNFIGQHTHSSTANQYHQHHQHQHRIKKKTVPYHVLCTLYIARARLCPNLEFPGCVEKLKYTSSWKMRKVFIRIIFPMNIAFLDVGLTCSTFTLFVCSLQAHTHPYFVSCEYYFTASPTTQSSVNTNNRSLSFVKHRVMQTGG